MECLICRGSYLLRLYPKFEEKKTISEEVLSEQVGTGCEVDTYKIGSALKTHTTSAGEPTEQLVVFRKGCVNDDLRHGLPVKNSGTPGNAIA